jgi:hypothetical protein
MKGFAYSLTENGGAVQLTFNIARSPPGHGEDADPAPDPGAGAVAVRRV